MHGEIIKIVLFIACSLLNNIASTTFLLITAGTRIDKDTSTFGYEFTPIYEYLPTFQTTFLPLFAVYAV